MQFINICTENNRLDLIQKTDDSDAVYRHTHRIPFKHHHLVISCQISFFNIQLKSIPLQKFMLEIASIIKALKIYLLYCISQFEGICFHL